MLKVTRMTIDPRMLHVLGLTLLLSVLPPVAAQEAEEDEEDGAGSVLFQVETWSAKPSGLDYSPATMVDSNGVASRLSPSHGTQSETRYRFAYKLPGDRGSLVGTWFAHEALSSLSADERSQFIFGETMADPQHAGFETGPQGRGLADAFDSEFKTVLRDLRVDYYRTAFTSPKIWAEWFAGIRRVQHNRSAQADYFALAPGLPPLQPPFSVPRPDLDPLPDTALMESKYSGRGIEAGMDFHIPLYKDRVRLDTGFSLAVMKGTVETEYRSVTHLYTANFGDGDFLVFPIEDLAVFINDPITGDIIPFADFVDQRFLPIGLISENEDTSGQVLETYLAFRFKLYRGLSAYSGYRVTHYADVGLDRRNNSETAAIVTEVQHSATYEGVFVGLEWAF